jgi:hypothetical protein
MPAFVEPELEVVQVALKMFGTKRADPSSLARLSGEAARRFLAKPDSRGKLVLRQCAIEDWFKNWAQADGASKSRLSF